MKYPHGCVLVLVPSIIELNAVLEHFNNCQRNVHAQEVAVLSYNYMSNKISHFWSPVLFKTSTMSIRSIKHKQGTDV